MIRPGVIRKERDVMRITALVENTASDKRFQTEHGLSLYIETEDKKILFDMGQTDRFLKNAGLLGIDLENVDLAVLSHGHYDHGGGLKYFLEINRKAPVYVSAFAFEPHYNGTEKYIGLDVSLMKNDRLQSVSDHMVIGEGLTLDSCNDREKKHDPGSFGLLERRGDSFYPDDFRHEQYLLAEENGKRILFSGCSHKGILNIVEWFRPDVLVGGFHFSKMAQDENLKNYADCFAQFPVDYYTCHCTGTEQYAYMSRYMDHLFYLSAGQSIEV